MSLAITQQELDRRLKAEYERGRSEGVAQERKRVSALVSLFNRGPSSRDEAVAALISGKSVDELAGTLAHAAAQDAASRKIENPPAVPTGATRTGSGEGADPKAEVEDILARVRKLG